MAVILVTTLVFLTFGLVVIPFNIAECKDHCTSDANCIEAEYDTGSRDCALYHTTQTPTDDLAKTFLKLECDPCSMSRTADSKGGVTTVQLSLTSADQCSSACLYITQCQGVQYSGNNCSIYGGSPSASNTGDDLNYFKQKCPTEKPCCMSQTSTLKTDAAPLFQLTSSLESCEAVCLKLSDCMSVYFLDSVCYVYRQETTIAQQTGSTYSVKTCTGASTATHTVTLECIGASGTKPFHSLYLGFLVIVFALLV